MRIDHTTTITLGGRKALRTYSIDHIDSTTAAMNLAVGRGTRFVGTPEEIGVLALAFRAIGYSEEPSR